MGRSCAIAFAHAGAKLILVDVNEEGLKETVKATGLSASHVKTRVLNITHDDELIAFIRSIPQMSDFGGRLDYAM
jgi:3-oxoacyl-[acyl-carrier protein] reductase